MPGHRTHKRVGSITALIFSALFIIYFYKEMPITGWKVLLVPLVATIYSQIPDLDSHSSRIKKRAFQVLFILMAISTVLSVFIHPLLVLVFLSFMGFFGLYLYTIPHRGPLHSFWFIFLAALPLMFLHWFLFLIGIVCATSHLLADWFWSGTKRKIKKALGIRSVYEINIRI